MAGEFSITNREGLFLAFKGGWTQDYEKARILGDLAEAQKVAAHLGAAYAILENTSGDWQHPYFRPTLTGKG